jgi:hypothetical protein
VVNDVSTTDGVLDFCKGGGIMSGIEAKNDEVSVVPLRDASTVLTKSE